jgi:hypothetical protein
MINDGCDKEINPYYGLAREPGIDFELNFWNKKFLIQAELNAIKRGMTYIRGFS